MLVRISLALSLAVLFTLPAAADLFSFSTGNPDGKIATASRPDLSGKVESETGDDFVTTATHTLINSATFTGLLIGGAKLSDIGDVRVEIYRVFPKDSDVDRTSGPPTFSTPEVPTRVNSPSDVELEDRDFNDGKLTFTPTDLGSFTAANSVLNGINPLTPGPVFTGGEGAVTGTEVEFDVTFTTPFDLPPDHYFFVPQVEVKTADGNFMWLSAPRPIVAPGTPFPAGFTDLQSWIRNEPLQPDWLRIGTDITHQGPFNATFSLTGEAVPEPSTWTLLAGALGLIVLGRKKLINR
jgi:hypothetical protein